MLLFQDLLTKFTAMKLQAKYMATMMSGGKPGSEKVMQELLEGTARPIAPGKIRRKKEKVKAASRDKSKGFG